MIPIQVLESWVMGTRYNETKTVDILSTIPTDLRFFEQMCGPIINLSSRVNVSDMNRTKYAMNCRWIYRNPLYILCFVLQTWSVYCRLALEQLATCQIHECPGEHHFTQWISTQNVISDSVGNFEIMINHFLNMNCNNSCACLYFVCLFYSTRLNEFMRETVYFENCTSWVWLLYVVFTHLWVAL